MSEVPLLLLHAFPLNGRMWAPVVDRLPGRTILTPDFPGFGGRAPGPETLDEFAAMAVEEVDRAGAERVVVGGLSMGGYVAFRIWSRSPERVAALILSDTRAGPDAPAAADRRTAQAERARKDGVGWLPDAMIEGLLGETTRRERADVVAATRAMMREASPEGVARALLAMRDRPDSRSLLPQIDVPTLVLVGEEDTLTGPDEARTIAEGVRGAELVVVPSAGHLSAFEQPAPFSDAVAGFLARL